MKKTRIIDGRLALRLLLVLLSACAAGRLKEAMASSAVSPQEAVGDEKSLGAARRQYEESLRLSDAGQAEAAIDLAGRALAVREKLLGPNHADVALSLSGLGRLYAERADFKRADALLARAAEVAAQTSSAESLAYADVLHNLARSKYSQGEHALAEQLNEQALAIRERLAGPDSLPVASSLQNLAALYRAANDLPKAEQTFLRVVAIREKLLGPDDVQVSHALNNLGLLYYAAGDYQLAETTLQRALAIREKALGESHAHVAMTLNNLGLVEWKKRDAGRAAAYYRRALKIYESVNGPESDGVAGIFLNLGILEKEAGSYAQAEAYYRRALTTWEKIFGEHSASTATAVSSLGILYKAVGDYERAEAYLLRANAINEKVLGPYDHYTILSLISLTRLYAAKGDLPRALEYQRRIDAVEEKIVPLNLSVGSERQKIAYFKQLQKLDGPISLQVRLAKDQRAACELAVTKVLQRKGRVLDALSANRSTLRRRLGAEDQELLERLNAVNAQLARLVLGGKTFKSSAAERTAQISSLEETRDQLEAKISQRSFGFYEGSQPVTLDAVRAAIPAEAALVEFAVYRPYDWKAPEDRVAYGDPHYVAYVVRRDGEVRWREIGPVKEIDGVLRTWREALRDPRRDDAREIARRLEEKITRPLRALAGDARQLLVSPDGELNLIPFEALVDEGGRYLVERYSFSYLTSGRDLLRMRVARESGGRALVIANPLFGEPVSELLVKATAGGRRRSVTAARDLSDVYFAPLGGTMREARTVQTIFPEVNLLTGAEATEAALKAVAAPRLLHIATHGFFLRDEGTQSDAATGRRVRSKIDNPLLRSGLALAGANLRAGGKNEDGILTALEASGLNLWGTKLVVLSACDTGLGEISNGEGIYGLRRAFALAGAESMLMSLWPASDYATQKLMAEYYRYLKQGLGRGPALRRVQLDTLGRDRQLHPFYWATFIQSGDWTVLDGRR